MIRATRVLAVLLVSLGGLLCGAIAPSATIRAAGPECPVSVGSPPGTVPRGGTITVRAGAYSAPCIVQLLDRVMLRADPDTAPPPSGRAIFRVSGTGIDQPGGLTIVASASSSSDVKAPEELPALHADAIVVLPRGARLVRFIPSTGAFATVPNGHIRATGVYKVLGRTGQPLPAVASPQLPSTLPATGNGPLAALVALAALAGSTLCALAIASRRYAMRVARPVNRGAAIVVIAVALMGAGELYTTMLTRAASSGFGNILADGPVVARSTGAAGPPTRLVIPRLGVDTRLVSLGIANGAWQVPAYAAGYLQGSAWPGRNGNEAVAGHDDRDGAVFRRLGDLRAGDAIAVYAGRHVYRYRVVASRIVPPGEVKVLRQTRGATLTLITCAPYMVDTQRLVIRATLPAR